MSLAYRLIGKPHNFDEFIDNAKRTGQLSVDVGMGTNCVHQEEGAYGLWTLYDLFSRLRAGRTEFRLRQYGAELLTPYDPQLKLFDATAELLRVTDEKRTQTEQLFLLEAIEVANRLRADGLEATIGGRSLEEAKEWLRKLQSDN